MRKTKMTFNQLKPYIKLQPQNFCIRLPHLYTLHKPIYSNEQV